MEYSTSFAADRYRTSPVVRPLGQKMEHTALPLPDKANRLRVVAQRMLIVQTPMDCKSCADTDYKCSPLGGPARTIFVRMLAGT